MTKGRTKHTRQRLDDLAELKTLYAQATLKGKEQFMYKGKPTLTAYAKYVIDYVEHIHHLKYTIV